MSSTAARRRSTSWARRTAAAMSPGSGGRDRRPAGRAPRPGRRSGWSPPEAQARARRRTRPRPRRRWGTGAPARRARTARHTAPGRSPAGPAPRAARSTRAGTQLATSSSRALAQPKRSWRGVRWPTMASMVFTARYASVPGAPASTPHSAGATTASVGVLGDRLDDRPGDLGGVEVGRVAAHQRRQLRPAPASRSPERQRLGDGVGRLGQAPAGDRAGRWPPPSSAASPRPAAPSSVPGSV